MMGMVVLVFFAILGAVAFIGLVIKGFCRMFGYRGEGYE